MSLTQLGILHFGINDPLNYVQEEKIISSNPNMGREVEHFYGGMGFIGNDIDLGCSVWGSVG